MGKPAGEWVKVNGAMANGHWQMGNGDWDRLMDNDEWMGG